MVRLVSVLAIAAATLLPAVFANETDCNISVVQFLASDRTQIASVSTDYEVTRYDYDVTSIDSEVMITATQASTSAATFTITVNGNAVSGVGDVSSPSLTAYGLNTGCGEDNEVVIEVNEVKSSEKRMDSCRFKYEIDLHNPACPSN